MTKALSILSLLFAAACGNVGLGDAARRDVTDQMNAVQDPIASCYETALRSDRKLRGRLVVSATAKANTGRFQNVKVVDSELPDEQLNTCIVKHVETLALSKPTTTDLAIRYPIEFSPLN